MLYRLITAKKIEGYTNLKVVEKPSVCPLLRGATVCVHSEASKAALVDICGDFSASTGSCQDKTYGSIVTTKDHIGDISEYTLRIIVQGEGSELGGAVDKFVQGRSRWIVDIMQGNGYELLTTFDDPRRLAFMSQLDLIQHRCANFFNGAINGNGFGSKWHTVALGLSFGLYHNMTLVTPEVLSNFIPLTSCTEADMERAFKKSPPEHLFANWTESTINFQIIGNDLSDMTGQAYLKTKTPGFEDKDLFWLRTMVAYYATRPNYQFREQFRHYSPIRTPCMSIHVRHSDKHSEAALLEFPDYMSKAEEYKSQTGVSNIYIMSDDGNVIKSTEQYKNFRFQYLDVPRPNEAWYTVKAHGVPMDILERDFLLDVYAAAQCEHQILTYSSNVGRLIGELSYAIRNKEPSLISMDTKWLMWP
ncbi:hypothetical protein EC957_005127 [Mortierella hygrophila]|uniref:Alpha-(1,6)-fucosyltransferase N- and catalytic domain-containing protein n=1 Tax=Mortierella hygrophila TaxID=979708 RepID=A0A9P6JZX0_9FUNG|nr:hypothetical protein EC957_005127 [Mortierella hygrophila]